MTKTRQNIKEKLAYIQAKLNVPKNQRNDFGKYNFRSCEDILEAVKPLLKETKTLITIGDEIVCVGKRYYVKAHAKLRDTESLSELHVNAYAREAEEQKGMNVSQITGSASSYARKYALNGLLAIDDTKDSDTTNVTSKSTYPTKVIDTREIAPSAVKMATMPQVKKINTMLSLKGINRDKFKELNKLESLNQLTFKKAHDIIEKLEQVH